MRVYFKIEDESYECDDDFKSVIQESQQLILFHMAVSMKYQVMWALRHLEQEMNNTELVITINWDNSENDPIVTLHGLDDQDALIDKIQAIVERTKFL